MSVGYILANLTKNQIVSFEHLPVSTKDEICGSPVAAKIVSLFLIENAGDEISFAPDQAAAGNWPLRVPETDLRSYEDVTAKYIDRAEELGYISGRSKDVFDSSEPEIFVWNFKG